MGSTTITQNQQVGASDNATSLGAGAKINKGIDLGSNAKLNTGLEFANANNSTITVGETGLGKTFADTIRSITEQNTSTLTSLVASNKPNPSLPSPDKDLKTNTKSNNGEGPNISLWIAGVLVAIGAAFFLFRGK